MSDQITYDDKVDLQVATNIANINKVTASDMNEIKEVLNSHADDIDELNAPEKWVSVGTTAPTDGRRVWFDKGKNLYVGSQDFSGIWENADKWSTANETYNGLVVKYRQGTWNGLVKEIEIERGGTYTFSFYAKKNTNGTLNAYTGGGVGAVPDNATFNATTEWQRFSFTFTSSTGGKLRARVENPTNNTTIYICGYQLEKNNTMTSYEPYIIPSVNVDNEQICEKELDTGWIDISSYVVTSNFAIRSGYTPKARRIGNRVYLKGEVYCKTAISNHTNKILASIPSTFRPTDQFSSSGVKYDLGVPYCIFIGTNGDITVSEGQNISVTPDFKGYQLTNLSGFLVD